MDILDNNFVVVLSVHALILGFSAVGVSRKHAFRITTLFEDDEVRQRLGPYNQFFTVTMIAGFISCCTVLMYAAVNYEVLYQSNGDLFLGLEKECFLNYLDSITLLEMMVIALLWPVCFVLPGLVQGVWIGTIRAFFRF